MKKILLFVIIAAVYILHQDKWNWPSTALTFDFLPIGLSYHAGYSLLAAAMMSLLVKVAWPSHLEDAEPHDPSADKKDGEEKK